MADDVNNGAPQPRGVPMQMNATRPVGTPNIATPAVVVPNEPTPEMLVAGRMADEDCDMPGQVYRAMIAAAQREQPLALDRVRHVTDDRVAAHSDSVGKWGVPRP